ncbi:MAG: chorismate-binding protein [Candidatus Omnitrophica bacterium]|nr:chorismate-binding protein [Candidatus Omnitrophota bacterium]
MQVQTRFENKPIIFKNPISIISCFDALSFEGTFQKIEDALKAGYFLAGFISYEAGYCFEEQLRKNKFFEFPLVYLGVYVSPSKDKLNFKDKASCPKLKNLRINTPYDNYSSDIQIIRHHIKLGDVYQITYCIKLLFDLEADPHFFYNKLLHEQPVPYPAFIETDDFQILSLSPEMFIKKQSTHVVTKPMKGTWPRGEGVFSDFFAKFRLKYDSKNRAENVMIADLLRNDLGRAGSKIRTPKLFEVAKYKTLHQMTSTVIGEVDKDISIYNLFASIFPSGSVTGAPKIRAMKIIDQLEKEERRIYTGAIGYITPDKDLFFNVPIRTILNRNKKAEMGIGGGIVWDSTPEGEWREGLLKARFVTDLADIKFNP